MRSLFERHNDNEPYVFAVGPCFYLEFSDFIEHERKHAEYLAKKLTPSDILNLLTVKGSDEFVRDVQILVGSESKDRIVEPAKKLSRLIQSNRIHGLGDYLQRDRLKERKQQILPQVRQLFTEQKRQRSATDDRRREDAEFHYWMDAWNIALTLNSGDLEKRHARLLLLTESRYVYNAYKGDEKEFVRSPFVPLYIKNALDVAAAGGALDSKGFLADAIYRGKLHRDQLKECEQKGVAQLPATVRDDLAQFYQNYVHRLEQFGTEPRENPPAISEELKWILSDPRRIREGAERVIADTEEAAREIASYAGACGLYLLDDFDLEANPVYESLTKRFRAS